MAGGAARPTARAPTGGIGPAAAARTSAYRPGPTARSATPAAACSPTTLFASTSTVTAKPELPAQVPVGRPSPSTARRALDTRYRVLASPQPDGPRHHRRGHTAARHRRDPATPARRRGAGHRRGPHRSRPRLVGRSCASACCPWTAWATPRAPSPAATSPTASSRPTRAPRSAAWASRSTRCSTASSGPSASARPARTACGASSPTPRTSCARRWPRSAATPSSSAWAPRASPPRSRRRCAASRTRRRGWACSSRTC